MLDFFTWIPAELDAIPRYLVAAALGLLIGLERERNPSAKAGLRTFALTSVFGVMASHLAERTNSPWLIAVGLLLIGGMIIAAYLRLPEDETGDPGTTTIAALVLSYGLGVLSWLEEFQLAALLGISSTLLLYFKPELRGLSERLTRHDLLSVLQFAVLSLVILPLLPDRNYGPYGALNPYQIWWMVVLISGVSLAGYAALRLVGRQRGAVALGILGGLVSSTATTIAFSRHARSTDAMASIAATVIVLSNLMMLIRVGVVVAVLAPDVLLRLLPLLIAGLATGGIAAWYGARALQPQDTMPELTVSNPTELRSALGFGALYAAVLLAAAWLSDWLGQGGLYAVSLVAGLTDVDAITLTSLRLHTLDRLPIAVVIDVITLAILSNIAFKSGVAVVLGGWTKARHAVAGMVAIATGVAGASALLHVL
jgi:uncharacterized membrane protein (DUF4010 family)